LKYFAPGTVRTCYLSAGICAIRLSTSTAYAPTIHLKSKWINKATKQLIRRVAVADFYSLVTVIRQIYRYDFSTQGIKRKAVVQTTHIKDYLVSLGRELRL